MTVAEHRADRRGRAGAGVRAAEAEAAGRGAVRPGAQAAAAVPAAAPGRGDVAAGRGHARHHPRRAPPLPGARSCSRRRRCRARAPRWRSPRRCAAWPRCRRRRRHHRRARRRLAGGSVGVQRGAGGARDRRLPRAGHLGGRPRDRLHHRRLRGRRARADAVGGGRAGGAGGGGSARRADPAVPAGGARRRAASCARATWRWSGRATRLGDPRRLLDERRQRLDELSSGRRRVLRRQLAAARAELRATRDAPPPRAPAAAHRRAARRCWSACASRWRRRSSARPGRRRHAHRGGPRKLEALSPLQVLERGFSLTQRRATGTWSRAPTDVRRRRRDHRAPARRRARRRRSRRRSGEPRGDQEGSGATNDPRAPCWAPTSARAARPPFTTPPFARWGSRASTRRISVDARGLSRAGADRCAREGYRYLNVTIPHKNGRGRAGDARSPVVRASGAANTLIFDVARSRAAQSAPRTPTAPACSRRCADLGRASAAAAIVMVGRGRRGGGRRRGAHRGGRERAGGRAAARGRRARCRRGCRRAQRARVSVAAWDAPGLAAALAGADDLVSAVPAAAWDRRRSARRAGGARSDGAAVLEMAYGAETPLARAVRGRGEALRRRPRHAGAPGRARDRAGAGQGAAAAATVPVGDGQVTASDVSRPRQPRPRPRLGRPRGRRRGRGRSRGRSAEENRALYRLTSTGEPAGGSGGRRSRAPWPSSRRAAAAGRRR